MFMQFGNKIEIGNKKIPLEKLSMLVIFYAPTLKPILEIMEEATLSFGKALVVIVNVDEPKEAKNQAIADLTVGQASIQKICEAMTTASADLARKYI